MKKLCFFSVLFYSLLGNAQIINFSDANFKAALVAPLTNAVAFDNVGNPVLIDANGNGEIEMNEAANPTIDTMWLSNLNLTNLSGIENFINIKSLDCSNNSLTSLNVQSMVNLVTLFCGRNQLTTLLANGLPNLDCITCEQNNLTTIDVSQCTVLRYLRIYENQLVNLNLDGLAFLTGVEANNNHLTSISFSGASMLWNLDVRNNFLTTLDVTSLTNLGGLDCALNQLTSLNVAGLSHMSGLLCDFNLLENIDLSGLSTLSSFTCTNNAIIALDLSSCTSLFALECQNNQLKYLNIKNGAQESNLYLSGNPTLEYICADENQLNVVESILYINGNTLCNFNTYCSFAPGGDFFTIQGNQKIDFDNNGCDSDDIAFPNLNFSISDGTNAGNFIANATGNYAIPLQQGTYSITPIIENPTYFTITPPSFQVNFPTQTSPFNQNFCISPNGLHNDLEVTIVPIIPARPGFNVTYKLIYKNKGTTTQSGHIEVTFDDAISDFISATPLISSQNTDLIVWDYSNLAPFETREITFVVKINAPTDTPAINGGDYLGYRALIFPINDDELPLDNNDELKQLVVNSFDPNDKTCSEGETATPEVIGAYVNYVIRFENTGTFAAENIVVKDLIDSTKFDVSTLMPISSSHSFVTKITNLNTVEFIFENINLPFEDATNDGYVAFKIKTLPSLLVGDVFTNSANIYFDYNFPIVTNTATTTINTLSHQDFDFDDYFSLSPVPTKDVLNITSKATTKITSISIYNALGQLVLTVTAPSNAIDVTSLKTGNYFIRVVSEQGISNSKFIKQ